MQNAPTTTPWRPRPFLRLFGVLALAAPCALAPSCGDPEQAPPPNVVLISIDTLRPDHLGCYGYRRNTSPEIDAIAANGALFEQHISSAPWTLPAHAAMFTSVPDSVHGVVAPIGSRLAEEFETLPESFQSAGYSTGGFFAGPYLHPAFGLGQGFDRYVDCVNTVPDESVDPENKWSMNTKILRASHHGVTNDKVYKEWQQFFEEESGGPFFAFVHLWDVHFDFDPPPPFDTMFDPDYDGPYTGRDFFHDPAINARMPKRDQEHIISLYDGEIRWTDEFVGKIRRDLEAKGLLQNTILVITSDHGTELFDHGGKGHRTGLFDEQIRIPLIIHYPPEVLQNMRFSGQTRMIDLGPTLRDLAGLPAVSTTMGDSLALLMRGTVKSRVSPYAVSELYDVGRELRSVRTESAKAIHSGSTDEMIWFDRTIDPGEFSPKPVNEVDTSRHLLELYQDAQRWILQGIEERPAGPAVAEVPDAIRRSLDAQGYAGSGEDEDQDSDGFGR